MTTKHTSAPWNYGIQTGIEDTHIITGPGGRAFIAELSNRSNDSLLIAANARLIAAAPELLEALEWLLNDPHTERGSNTAITFGHKVMARATGAV